METKDFFEKVGDTVNRAAEVTGRTAKIVAEIARLNCDNVRKRDDMRKSYTAIGKTYVDLMGDDPDEEMCEYVAAVFQAQAVIAENKAKIAELKAQLRGEFDCDEPGAGAAGAAEETSGTEEACAGEQDGE